MAEKDGFKQSAGENALFWVIVLILILITFRGLVGGDAGNRPGLFNFFGAPTASLSSDILPGTRVSHSRQSTVFSEPGSDNAIGTAAAGIPATILDGPVLRNGINWWKVRYENGVVGWVNGNTISVDPERNISAVTNDTPIGSRVVNVRELEVFSQPGAGQRLGSRPRGAKGTLLQKGFSFDGLPVWNIDYDFDPDGWVDQDGLEIDAETNDASVTEATPIGSKVINEERVTVREQPRRGSRQVAQVRAEEQGTIVDGPALVDDELWFKVRYENGTEGWVRNEHLQVDTENDPFALKDTTQLGTRIEHTESGSLWAEPGGGEEIGTIPQGTQGVLIDGPVIFEGERWWRVQYADGTRGWITAEGVETAASSRRDRRNRNRGVEVANQDETERGVARSFSLLRSLGIFLSLFLVAAIIYFSIRISQIRTKENQEIKAFEEESKQGTQAPVNNRWQRVLDHVNSENENDWRLAILEADVMLDDMMSKMGYTQESLGEKLKSVERSDFATLDLAWEGHLFRNKLAHEGSAFPVTQREARRIIELYRKVFEEFRYI